MQVLTFYSHVEHTYMHDSILSLRVEILAYKTSLASPLFSRNEGNKPEER